VIELRSIILRIIFIATVMVIAVFFIPILPSYSRNSNVFNELIRNSEKKTDIFYFVKDVGPLFDSIMSMVLHHEGDRFVYDRDINEISRRGITLQTYQQYYGSGNSNSIRNLSEEQAMEIYKSLFWSYHNLDSIAMIGFPKTAAVLMDSQVNIGPYRANKYLQRKLGVSYSERTGRIDSLTISIIKETEISDEELSQSILNQRRYYYSQLVERKPVYQKFYNGWNNRIDSMERFIKSI
jgi:lysozyme family protein